MTVTESRTRVLAHTVRCVHATTKQPVAVRARFKVEPPTGWALRVSGNVVAVTRDTKAREPESPLVLTLTATDPALRLAAPVADVALPLPAAEDPVWFAPLPSVVEVRLTDKNGKAVAKQKLKVQPGPATARTPGTLAAVALTEDSAVPGTYRAEHAWNERFHPLDVRVKDSTVRSVPYDPTSAVQRIRLVDTT